MGYRPASEICGVSPRATPLYEIVQPFLEKFNYHKLLMANFSSLKMVRRADGGCGIYDERDGENTLAINSEIKN